MGKRRACAKIHNNLMLPKAPGQVKVKARQGGAYDVAPVPVDAKDGHPSIPRTMHINLFAQVTVVNNVVP